MTAVQPLDHNPFPDPHPAHPSATPLVHSAVYLEVIAPSPTLPALPGWQLLVWPQARLGDLTLAALPERPTPLTDLLDGLRAQGFTPLGYRLRG